MATARERAKIASEEALRRKTAKPGLLRTHSTTSRTATRATGPTISRPPARPLSSTTRVRPASQSEHDSGTTKPAATSAVLAAAPKRRPAAPTSGASQNAPQKLVRTAKADTAVDPTANKENSPASSPINPPSDHTASTTQDAASSDAAPVSSLTSPKKSPRKIELRSINRSPRSSVCGQSLPSDRTHSRTTSATVDRKPLADLQSENAGDQHMREAKITSDLLQETQKREELERELAALKDEIRHSEDQKGQQLEDALATARAEADEALQSQGTEHIKLVDSLRQQLASSEEDSASNAAARTQYENQITTLQAEIEALHKNPSKLKAVGAKIAEVEAALQESRSTASELQNGLEEEISKSNKDKIELAQTIEELKDEIDRAQKQLDDESAKQRKEKEAALRVTEKLREELRDIKTAHGSEKKVLEDKTDAASKFSAELEEKLRQREVDHSEKLSTLESEKAKLRKSLDESKQELDKATVSHESIRQRLMEGVIVAERQAERANQEAEETIITLEDELKTLREAMAADQERARTDSGSAANRISELQDTISQLQQTGRKDGQLVSDLQGQLETHRAENTEKAAKQESDLKGMASVTENLQKELEQSEELNQRLKKEKNELLSSSRQAGEGRRNEIASLKAQISRLREEADEKAAWRAELLAEAQGEAHALREQIEQVAGDKEQALVEVRSLKAAIAEQKQSSTSQAAQAQEELLALQHRYEILTKEHESSARISQEAEALKAELAEVKQKGLADSDDQKASVEKLQSQVKELESAAEGANSDLLKAVQDKDLELETLKTSVKSSDAKLSAHRAEFQDIQATLESTISDLRTQFQNLEAKHADELKQSTEKLKEDHLKVLRIKDSELVTLRDWVSGSENAVSQVVQLKEEKLSLERCVADLKQQVSEMKSTQTAAVESAKKDLKTHHNLEVESLRSAHEGELSNIKATHESALTSLQASARSQNEALQSQQSSLHEQINLLLESQAKTGSHDSEIQGLKDALAAAQTEATDTATKLIQDHNAQLKDQQGDFQQRLALLTAQHTSETQSLNDKLHALSTTPPPALVVAELSSRIADLEIALSTARADADRAQAEKQALLALQQAPRSIASRSSGRSVDDPFVEGEGTVEGTLASIAEQVRALEELNESFGTPRARRSSALAAGST